MTPKQRVEQFVTENNIDLYEGEGGVFDLSLRTPPGKIWNANMCHQITVFHYTNRPAGWKRLLEDINEGLTDCTDTECEHCS